MVSGPPTWSRYDPQGRRQSPINITLGHIKLMCLDEPVTWCRYSSIPQSMTLHNTGHTREQFFYFLLKPNLSLILQSIEEIN